MKKTLKLIKVGNDYKLFHEDENLLTISDKKISGSEIFERIYSSLGIDESSEISIVPEGFIMDGSKIKEKEDKLVFDQIKDLFSKIDKAIKDSISEKTK